MRRYYYSRRSYAGIVSTHSTTAGVVLYRITIYLVHLAGYLVSSDVQNTEKGLNMATKKTKAVTKQPDATDRTKLISTAKVTLLPSANSAAIIADYGKAFGNQDVSALMDELRPRMKDVNEGDLKHCEAMLVGQAHALQSIFMNLARRAINQDYLKQYETYLRLALKAQNQSRMTLETLAAIKNPPVVFARQANINQGSGNQQVNNGTPPATPNTTHAGKNINQPNELLEVQHGGETLDSSTTSAAIKKSPAMAAVG